MIKIDISNKHKKRFVAFGLSINNIEHIIASDTKLKLMKFLVANNVIFEDFYIFNGCGRLVAAYTYNNTVNVKNTVNYDVVVPYTEMKFI